MSEKLIKVCPYCQGEGGRCRGHYDAFWAECSFCEKTGKAKFRKCRNCNKYGEVYTKATKDLPLGGTAACPDCKGSAMVPMTPEELAMCQTK